jgi:polyhydroxyalkanoate synthase subunit PhaC
MMVDNDQFARLLAEWGQLNEEGFATVWQDYLLWLQTANIAALGLQQVGQTPATAVWRRDRVSLHHYLPTVERRFAIPILCIPSLISRYYILDLLPERSLVAYLVGRGFDVYLLDWGRPSPADSRATLDDHISQYLYQAVETARQISGSERISLLGYCMGGMFSAVYTALYGRHIANLVNLAGPINYHDEGIFSALTRHDWFDVDRLVELCGNIPAELLLATFQALRPTANFLRAFHLRERRDDPAYVRGFAAMQTWVIDQVDFPGETFRRYIKDLYQQNQLVNGRLRIEGERVRLERIHCPTLTIASQNDETAPAASVAALNDLISSPDKQFLLLSDPHVGMVAGRRAPQRLWPQLADWLAARSERAE